MNTVNYNFNSDSPREHETIVDSSSHETNEKSKLVEKATEKVKGIDVKKREDLTSLGSDDSGEF
jgi:hypothetical protein